MSRAMPPLSGKNAAAVALATAVGAMPDTRFAAIDGAWFDDLQRDLLLARLNFVPLFREVRDQPAQAASPYLVELRNRVEIEEVVALVAGRPAVVFWSWPEGSDRPIEEMARHLRGLNLVEIPAGADDPEAEEKAAARASPQPQWETVLFRHTDPNVLAGLLPLFGPAQVSRLLGRATHLLFDAPDYRFEAPGGESLRGAPRPADLPLPPHGMLRINPQQYELLTRRQTHVSRLEIMDYLRENATEEVADQDDRTLFESVREADEVALELGMESGEARGLFAYLSVTTGGTSLQAPEIRDAFSSGAATPDDTMRAIFQEMTDAAGREG
ncbi:MAG: DUF4123 domain-containing protein [Rhizobiaceae bacterium]|nr:DUF4123 domain-containing protein [Rhizobiaceae bacterium]MCV0408028.1 DUF4123 domain-containing protein [Rhizobiaceae bacterium]